MNYYERHIGDYLKDTAHLSLLEHGVYGRLLDIYYTREGPIPEAQVMRLVGARADEERSAVRDVLNEFFTRDGENWHHARCDRELERYRDKSAKAKKSAQASVESRRATAELTNRELRSARMAAAREKGRHTDEEWKALREFCGFKCVRCGAEGHQDRDHILPVYQGGSDGIDNIQPLCARCNASKGSESVDHRPSGWRAFVEQTLGERSAPNHQTPGTISSVPIGTDAAAASASPKVRNPEEQAKADLWRTAVEVLLAGGCNTEATCRTFMGKLVTDYGFDVVQKAVASAVTAQPADAREYLKATCQRLKGERKDPVTVPSKAAEETAQALAAERARPVTKPPPEVAALIASAVKKAA